MSKKLLQWTMAVLATVPVLTGIFEMSSGIAGPLYGVRVTPTTVLLDSNFRFFAGLWLALGATTIWLIPSIATQTTLFRVIWGMMFIGGVGRVLSMLQAGPPPVLFVFFTALEIAGAPLFIYWQARIAESPFTPRRETPA